MNPDEPLLLSLLVLDWTADGSCGKHREFLVGWTNRVHTNLEQRFPDRDFVATRGFHRRRHPDGARALVYQKTRPTLQSAAHSGAGHRLVRFPDCLI